MIMNGGAAWHRGSILIPTQQPRVRILEPLGFFLFTAYLVDSIVIKPI